MCVVVYVAMFLLIIVRFFSVKKKHVTDLFQLQIVGQIVDTRWIKASHQEMKVIRKKVRQAHKLLTFVAKEFILTFFSTLSLSYSMKYRR